MFTENLDAFLSDFGVPVVWSMPGFPAPTVIESLGILDMPDEVIGDLVLSTEYSLTVKTSIFESIDNGSEIEVDGIDYVVRDVRKIDDGRFMRLRLSKV